MQTKPRFCPNSPEIKAYLQDVGHTFTREGIMVAFPTCYPGMTISIVPDESHITALEVTPDGKIYGGTSGRQTHLFVASFHGNSGLVLDVGPVAGATRCAAVCSGGSRFLAFVNGERGGRAISGPAISLADDFIQEWGLERPELTDHGECVPGEPVVHAVADPSRKVAVGITSGHIFIADLATAKIEVIGELHATGRIAVASRGSIVGRDGSGHLWLYDPMSGAIRRQAAKLPEGSWDHAMVWAADRQRGLLYTANDQGRLFSFDEKEGFGGPLGRAPLAPVGPMAVTLDGRIFGFCGAEMAKMFCYDPHSREVSNLGVAVSVIERRRYGYVFGDAVTGRDGEIVFGEDDDGGHVWLCFPRIRAERV